MLRSTAAKLGRMLAFHAAVASSPPQIPRDGSHAAKGRIARRRLRLTALAQFIQY